MGEERPPGNWDYLLVTAANAPQAAAYQTQIRLRREVGWLPNVREVLVIQDMDGHRIGSGGSTIQCLAEIVNRESVAYGSVADIADVESILRRVRILIVHAGGDSRRLPAYSACGKLFVPLPGETGEAGETLFERLVATFLDMTPGPPELGQIVVAAGDALIEFDPSTVELSTPGLIALGAWTTPEEASRHGVLVPGSGESVRLYLQKPAIAEQWAAGAVGPDGRSIVDIAVMSLDGATAAALTGIFCQAAAAEPAGHRLVWKSEMLDSVLSRGLDLYREICCALGTEVTMDHYFRAVRASGSAWPEPELAGLYAALRPVPIHLQVPDSCAFLHFGSTRQLISSGLALLARDRGEVPASQLLQIATEVEDGGSILGHEAWLDACRVSAPLRLGGRNVLVGVEVSEPLDLPPSACLDLSAGHSRQGEAVWFVRCYGVDDTFKSRLGDGATFCGMPLDRWLAVVGAGDGEIWNATEDRTLWTARVFPVEQLRSDYRRWLWMFNAAAATSGQKRAFLKADRYSAVEIALLVDQQAFYAERQAIRMRQRCVGAECK